MKWALIVNLNLRDIDLKISGQWRKMWYWIAAIASTLTLFLYFVLDRTQLLLASYRKKSEQESLRLRKLSVELGNKKRSLDDAQQIARLWRNGLSIENSLSLANYLSFLRSAL